MNKKDLEYNKHKINSGIEKAYQEKKNHAKNLIKVETEIQVIKSKCLDCFCKCKMQNVVNVKGVLFLTSEQAEDYINGEIEKWKL